jgi:hypothetical protein
VGCPIRIDSLRPRYLPASSLGADTAGLLAEIGVSAQELAALRRHGVV